MNNAPFSRRDWLNSAGTFALILASGVCRPSLAGAGDNVGVIDIGSRRELFVDRHLIASLDGVRLVLHSPQPRSVALRFDQPWETLSPGHVALIHDSDVYRMYYRARHTPPNYGKKRTTPRREVTCYAESKDGIRWTRPRLGLVTFEGSKENNIMWDGVGTSNFTPFKDRNPDCPPDARYKAIGRGRPLADEPSPYEHGLYALKSSDAIHWQVIGDGPIITQGGFDSQNVMFWDTVSGVYRAYWRASRPRNEKIPPGRDVRTAVSKDGITWGNSRLLEYEPGRRGTADTDGPAHQYYTNGIGPYYRAPHILLGLPKRYIDRGWTTSTEELPEIQQRRNVSAKLKRLGTAITDTMLITSRDGVRFYVWPEAFIRPGIQRQGNWFYGDAGVALGIVETASSFGDNAPSELSFYVRENARLDIPGQLRRYTLRLDGFVSLNASLEGGTVLTKPVAFDGDRLEINFATSAGGSLRVEIQDKEGKPIPGFTLADCHLHYGDQVDRCVSWNAGSDVRRLASKPIRLRFEMKDADLYSFRFVAGR